MGLWRTVPWAEDSSLAQSGASRTCMKLTGGLLGCRASKEKTLRRCTCCVELMLHLKTHNQAGTGGIALYMKLAGMGRTCHQQCWLNTVPQFVWLVLQTLSRLCFHQQAVSQMVMNSMLWQEVGIGGECADIVFGCAEHKACREGRPDCQS